ncbi:kinase-regulated stress-responsive transcription factor skn7 [Tulasnella sp. 424]|nr:kinase-regulated stress-responsive transcription factor skn7 [Tulasnella sp. 424]KAG8959420.1 kinase-regulated stress-responsive transcription factor skn7 [Tulasnella sp. 425]
MADMSGFITPKGLNFGIPTQYHNPNQPQHHPPGVTSTPNGTLRNEQRQTFFDTVLHSQQRNQNATQTPHPQQGWQSNQLTGGNQPLTSAGPSVTVNPTDDTELLESPGGSRLRIRFTPAWVVPPRVLLVDDDQVSRKIFSKFLQVSGCTIDVAVDGILAVDKMNLEKYDLVLMDIVMPKLDGVSATSLIRQFDHMTPIIAMTSKSKPNDVVTYYASGMNDILPKPFTRESLFAMLEKHLNHLKRVAPAQPASDVSSFPHLNGMAGTNNSSPPSFASNANLVNDSLAELSPMERSILARQESMQRLEELKQAREAPLTSAVADLSSTTPIPGITPYLTSTRASASGLPQVVSPGGQPGVEIVSHYNPPRRVLHVRSRPVTKREKEEASASISPSATPDMALSSQPATAWTYPHRQKATIQEGSLEPRPSNSPSAARAGLGLSANLIDNTELLESPGGSRPRIRKGAFTPAWADPPRVLLVEDDQVSREIFSKFLQVSGCTIDVAVDGSGAVNKMNLEKYDLVLMDIVMPKLDGVSATSLIRQFDHMTPIIAMTSNTKPNDVVTYYSSGMNDILPKPFTRESLFTMLEKHLMHLKAITMARPVAEEPSKVLSDEQYSAMLNLLGMSADGMNGFPSLDPTVGIVMTDPAGSAKRALEAVEDDRETKRPRFEVVE